MRRLRSVLSCPDPAADIVLRLRRELAMDVLARLSMAETLLYRPLEGSSSPDASDAARRFRFDLGMMRADADRHAAEWPDARVVINPSGYADVVVPLLGRLEARIADEDEILVPLLAAESAHAAPHPAFRRWAGAALRATRRSGAAWRAAA